MAIEEQVPGASGAVRQIASPDDTATTPSRLIQSIVEAIATSPRSPAWLVAPARRVARQWIDQIALGGTPVFNLHGTTPSALSYDLAAAVLAANGRRVASPRASLVLLEKVLVKADLAGRLRYFHRPRSYARLAERMFKSVSAIRLAGLTAADVRDRPGFGITAKGQDIAHVLEAYAAELATAVLVDAADVAAVAIEEVTAGRLSPGLDRILVPAGIDLTPLERQLFAALGDRVQALAIDPEPQAFEDPKKAPSLHFFRAIGEVNEVRGVLRRCLADGLPLDTVELLHTDAATYPSLVQEVLATLTDAASDPSAPAIDLPVTFAEGLPIRGSRPARALSAWLAWRAEGHPQWRLIRMVRDGLLNQITTGDGNGEPLADAEGTSDGEVTQARLVSELRRLRVGFDLVGMPSMIRAAIAEVEALPLTAFQSHSRDPDDDSEFDEAAAERKRGQRVSALDALASIADHLVACEPPPNATAVEVVAKARSFLENLAASPGQFDNNAKNRLLAEITDTQRWLKAHPDATPRETLTWLQSLTESLVVMGSGPQPGCLHVASIASGGHSGRRHTFIVGLDETRFPGPGTSDPVLPDADRAMLSDDLEIAASAAAKARTEFWRLLGRLRGNVHLAYSCRDLVEQSERFPSPLLIEAFRRHTLNPNATLDDFLVGIESQAIADGAHGIGADADSFVTRDPATALNDSERWLAMLGEDPSMPAVRHAIEAHSARLARGLDAEEARRSTAFTPWDGLVPAAGPSLDPTSPHGRVASAHSLESLGACPRRFFFSYGLGVEPLDTLEPEADRWLDPMEHGSVLHTVLERFMQPFRYTGAGRPADGPRPVFDLHEGQLLAILDAVLESKRLEKPTNDETSVAMSRRALADALRTFLKAEEEYCERTGSRPVALEAAIGFGHDRNATAFDRREPVSLPLPGGNSLRLRGFVDRIDIDGSASVEHGYVVIDYKSGRSSRFKKSGTDRMAVFDKGRRLQHGLYVMMVRHVARERMSKAADVTQFAYVFPGADTHGERVAWTADDLANIDSLVGSLCRIAAAGTFLPTTDANDCRFCDFLDVCGAPAATVRDSSRKLENDDGRYGPRATDSKTLAELFEGIREAKTPAPAAVISRPKPQAFEVTAEEQPGRPGDADARQAVKTELHTSMLVEASAGTGKTTCMVDRMTALVRTGTATVGQIAAITFTKKAAAELARRFRERLEKDSAASSLDVAERKRLQEALAEIDSAAIGTVHSFCGRLLRERPIEAGLDPAVDTMDAAAEQVLRGRAWREFCELTIRDESLAEHRRSLEEAGIALSDVRAAFDSFVANADVRIWPHDPVDPPDVRDLMSQVGGEIDDLLRDVFMPWSERAATDRLMERLEGVLRAYRTRLDDSPAALFRAAEQLEGNCPKVVQSLWLPGPSTKAHRALQKERVEEITAWWASVVDRVRGPLTQWRAYRYQFVIPLLEAARDHYEQLRLDEGLLSFHDLLDRTARLLRERTDVRAGFAKRHPFLLVDEFQDTDPLQAEILLLLAADDSDATDWRLTRIRPGSLFVVGDPKQSIYRFRRADIDTFEFVKARIEASGGRILHFNTNFRTSRDLVDWVNDQFADRFATHRPPSGEKFGPAFIGSEAGRGTVAPGCLTGLRQLRVPRFGVKAEAEAVACFIRRAIDHGLTVPRASTDVSPACRPEDFMIVTWDTGELSTYAEALSAVGLPCEVTGRKGPNSKDALSLLQLCLRVVADADDAVAALAILRGPVFGFSDADLYAFRQAGGTIDGRLRVPAGLADKTLASRCLDASSTFSGWRRLAGSLPLVAALERIVDDAGLLLVASVGDGRGGRRGRAAVGTIATFIERVRAERSLVTSVQDVVDRIDDLVADEFPRQDFDTVSIDAAAGGAVRVMNLHKVKGLEAPIVFLCDQNGPKRDRSPTWHVSRTEGEPRGYLTIAQEGFFGGAGMTLAAPGTWDAHEAIEKRYLEAEYLRLNYVAGTRPGSCLVVSAYVNKDGEIMGGWQELSPDLAGIADLPALEPCVEVEAARLIAAARPVDDAVARARGAELAAASRMATYGTVTPRDFLTEPAEAIRHTGRGRGQDWGTLIHRLLELAAQNGLGHVDATALEVAAASAIETSDLADVGLDREDVARRAAALVNDIRTSPLWQRIEASCEQRVEVPFSIAVDSDAIPTGVAIDYGPRASGLAGPALAGLTLASTPVLIRGQIDAVFRDGSTPPPPGMTDWVIVDWKTTSVSDADSAALDAHYRPQVELYARCWAAGLSSRSA